MQKKNDASNDPPSYRINDPEQFARNVLRVFEHGGRAVTQLLERSDSQLGPYSAASEMTEATKTMTEVARSWWLEPQKVAEAQASLFQSYAELWNHTLRRMMGQDGPPVAEPEASDNRFRDPEWTRNPYFDFWKQAYLVTSNWAEAILQQTGGLDDLTRRKAEFYLRQITSAASPSNFPLTNPEVLHATLATNAQNLVTGMEQFAADMGRSGDLLKISQTDSQAFEIGRNLAMTPGKVVFQNDVMQLIQYSPSTGEVREIPLLMVPPWINKYYILDLAPAKSLIKYIVDQGFTVFIVSWVNPGEGMADKTFEDYMQEGVLTAADAVRRETGVEQSNVLGYCVGGTLVGTTLAYLAARGEEPFRSCTFLTTQIDFRHAGDLLLFTSGDQLRSIDELMKQRGYLDGSRMANVFNMLRPRDLIWPYVVNNYLLGKKPFPFDLLFWNQDSTRMPCANHSFYLREFYSENRLANGEMVIGGTRLDLGKIKLPVFELATKEDHIAPARSVLTGANQLSSDVEFVLSGSGHIAGVINPPDKMKYQFWTSNKRADSLEEWVEGANEHPGSWWPYWIEWLTKHSGKLVPARTPGLELGVIEDAPGSYVKVSR